MKIKNSAVRIRDIENRLVVAEREEGGREADWEFGISRCKPLCTEWINKNALLYSTVNHSQYPVTTIVENNMKNTVQRYI